MITITEAADLATSTGHAHIGYLTEYTRVTDIVSGKVYTFRPGAVVTCRFDELGDVVLAGTNLRGFAHDPEQGIDTETYARRMTDIGRRAAERVARRKALRDARAMERINR